MIASLVESCKLNDVDPYAYLADTLAKIVDGPSRQRNRRASPVGLRQGPAAQRRGLRTTLTIDRIAYLEEGDWVTLTRSLRAEKGNHRDFA